MANGLDPVSEILSFTPKARAGGLSLEADREILNFQRPVQSPPVVSDVDSEILNFQPVAPTQGGLQLQQPAEEPIAQPEIEAPKQPALPEVQIGTGGISPGFSGIAPALSKEQEEKRRSDLVAGIAQLQPDKGFEGQEFLGRANVFVDLGLTPKETDRGLSDLVAEIRREVNKLPEGDPRRASFRDEIKKIGELQQAEFGQKKRTIGKALKQRFATKSGLVSLVPFIGSMPELNQLSMLKGVAKRLESDNYEEFAEAKKKFLAENPNLTLEDIEGDPSKLLQAGVTAGLRSVLQNSTHTRESDIEIVRAFQREERRKAAAGSTLPAKVVDILGELPAFVGELALTGGAFKAAKKVGIESVRKFVKKGVSAKARNVAAKIAGGAFGTLTQASLLENRVVANALERSLPQFSLKLDDLDKIDVAMKDGDPALLALWRGWLDTVIEVGSERSGEAITKGATRIARKVPMPPAVVEFLSKSTSPTGKTIAKGLRKAHISSMPVEMLEERIGDAARGLTGLERWEDLKPDRQQLLTEAVAFAIPGVAGAVTGKIWDSVKGKTAQERIDNFVSELAKDAGIPPVVMSDLVARQREIRESTEEVLNGEPEAAVRPKELDDNGDLTQQARVDTFEGVRPGVAEALREEAKAAEEAVAPEQAPIEPIAEEVVEPVAKELPPVALPGIIERSRARTVEEASEVSPAVDDALLNPDQKIVDAPGAPAASEQMKKDQSLTRARVNAALELANLPQVKKEDKQKLLDAEKSVIESGMVDQAEMIASRLKNEKGLVPTIEEVFAMSIRFSELEKRNGEIVDQKRSLLEQGKRAEADLLNAEQDQVLASMALISQGTAKSTTSAARAMRAIQEGAKIAELDSRRIVETMVKSKGEALSSEEAEKVSVLQGEIARLEQEVETQTQKAQEAIDASRASNAAKNLSGEIGTAKRRRSKKLIRTSRKNIKDELRKIGLRVNDITGVGVDATILLGRLAKTYIDEGITDLKQLQDAMIKDVPDLSVRDVNEVLAGRSTGEMRKAQTGATKTLRELQRQARLVIEIEDLTDGMLAKPGTRAAPSKRVAELREQRDELKKQLVLQKEIDDAANGIFKKAAERGVDSLKVQELKEKLGQIKERATRTIREKARRDALQGSIDRVNEQIDGGFRDIQEGRRPDPERVVALKQELADARAIMRTQDQITLFDSLLAKGAFGKKDTRTVPAKLKSLRKKLQQLKSSASQTVRDDARLRAIISKLEKVEEQIDSGERDAKKGRRVEPEKIREAKDSLSEARSFMRTMDQISEVDRQIREKDFDVAPARKAAISSERLEKARINLKKKKKEARDLKEFLRPKTKAEKALRIVAKSGSTVRALLTFGEMSGLLRQGNLILAHQAVSGLGEVAKGKKPTSLMNVTRAIGQSISAAFSKNSAEAIEVALENDPKVQEYINKYGLDVTQIDGPLDSQQEEFMDNYAERIPVIKTLIAASARNQTVLLNMLRVSAFGSVIDANPTWTDAQKEAWAKTVNAMSGRSSVLKKFLTGRGSQVMGLIGFAPNFSVSRIEAPARIIANLGDKGLRRESIKTMAGFVTMNAMFYALSSLAGGEVGDDPEEFDYGRVTFGNTKIDLMAGINQPVRVLMLSGLALADEAGIRKASRKIDVERALWNFIKYRQSPLIGLPGALAFGKDALGRPKPRLEILRDSIIPLYYQDVFETAGMNRKEIRKSALANVASLGFFGASVINVDSELLRPSVRKIYKKAGISRINPPTWPDWLKERKNINKKRNVEMVFNSHMAQWLLDNKDVIESQDDPAKFIRNKASALRRGFKASIGEKEEESRIPKDREETFKKLENVKDPKQKQGTGAFQPFKAF